MTNDPNSFDKEIEDAQNGANPQQPTEVTEPKDTDNPSPEAEPAIDYKIKFSESSKEALRLKRENEEKDRILREREEELERLRKQGNPVTPSENLYPGFEELDEEAKKNLIDYTNMVKEGVKKELYNDPAISFSRQLYNEKKFNEAFEQVAAEMPELASSKEEFKKKYYNPSNVPDNIGTILKDVAKIHLYDKAREIGAQEEKQRADRIDMERAHGGDKTPRPSRSLEDWRRMAQENPVKFAQLSKEYQSDLEAGRI